MWFDKMCFKVVIELAETLPSNVPIQVHFFRYNIYILYLKNNIYIFFRYGLLGASGCGKTTLLSCIVGRRRLNAGEIWVLGGRPGGPGSGVPGPRIGYMPQVKYNYFYYIYIIFYLFIK